MTFATPALAVLFGLIPLAFVLRSKRQKEPARASQSTLSAEKPTPIIENPHVAATLRDYDF